ncbi:MAG: class I SAM-dependent methyltransferase [Dehalococcoidia bacterium]|nr:class I SAM-dependent methyltransferase [Dehalococcoidia bacterium]
MPPEPNPWVRSRTFSGDDYDARYEAQAAAGEDVHGEANFVEAYAPHSVLDAGCGTGRVGRELARRGIDVVGVDLDAEMLATARRKAAGVDWRLGDLASIDLGRTFDLAVAAGNVMIFLTPGSEAAVIANIARHLTPAALLIAGFQLGRSMPLGRYDELCSAAGLTLRERFATWDRDAWRDDADYAVSVHRRAAGGDEG